MRTPIRIAPGVYRLGSSLVNWYLVEDGGRLTVVDAGVPRHARGLEEALGEIGHAIGDIDALILTHAHADHTGVSGFLRARGVPVHVHQGDRHLLIDFKQPKNEGSMLPYLRHLSAWRLLIHLARGGALSPPTVADPVHFVAGDVLDVPGRPRVIGTPGHTEGHCVFSFERRSALLVGDALCTWNPLTGRVGAQIMPSAFNLSSDRCLESLSRIEYLEADFLLPGHGEPWTASPAEAVERARRAGRS
jgi:glyoxylase-like metal-dependent hydrolase (beta-lactamase superfamily II)